MIVLAGCDRGESNGIVVPEEPGAAHSTERMVVEPAVIPAEVVPEEGESSPDGGDGAAAAEVSSIITPTIHGRFVRGISLAAARALLSVEPESVGGDGSGTATYRWEDETGAYFTARFEQDALVVRSALRQRPTPLVASASAAEPGTTLEMDGTPVAEVAPGVYVPLERAITSSVEQPRGVTAPPRPIASAAASAVESRVANGGPTVVVAGAHRRQQQEAVGGATGARSYQPRAKLPDFYHGFSEGRYEIRFVNPTGASMTVGLRQDKLGENVVVPAKGQASLHVDRGVYQLYFILDDDPDGLYEAEPLRLDGFHASDVAVSLSPDDVSVEAIDYSLSE